MNYRLYSADGIVQASVGAPEVKIPNSNLKRLFTVNEGVGILLAGIFAVIFLYFVAYSVPGALSAIATTALVSVNAGVATIFQVLFSIVAVFTFLLILVAVIEKVIQ